MTFMQGGEGNMAACFIQRGSGWCYCLIPLGKSGRSFGVSKLFFIGTGMTPANTAGAGPLSHYGTAFGSIFFCQRRRGNQFAPKGGFHLQLAFFILLASQQQTEKN